MKNGNGRVKRLIAGGVVSLLGLTFAPGAADAAISTTTFCANVPAGQSGFTDIAQAGVHQRNVECLKGAGIVQGTTATTYSPQSPVTRAQMATFIANLADFAKANDNPGGATVPALPTAAAAPDKFTDDEGSVHENNINRLAAAGIVNGTSATTFSPNDTVSRGQMASFVAQAVAFIRGAALPEGTDQFTDDEDSVHEANINRLGTADIADGTGAARNGKATFGDNDPVNRAPMASFINQAGAFLNAEGTIGPIPVGGAQQQFTGIPQTTEARGFLTGDSRTCTISGLTSGISVNARVIPSEDRNAAGNFLDANSDNVYDETAAPGIVIVNVNGAPAGPAQEINGIVVSPVGAISVTFGSAGAPDDVTLLLWQDSAGFTGNALDLVPPAGGANAQPKASRENFGTGCRTFFGAESPGGAFNVTVASEDKATNLFSATPGTGGNNFFYDANDTFQINGVPQAAGEAGLAVFEGFLSPGDTVSGTYAPDPSGVSTFNLVDGAPVPPNTLVLTAPTNPGTTINGSFNESTTPTADSYNVFRIIRPPSGTCPNFDTAAGQTAFGAPVRNIVDPTPGTVGGTALTFSDTGLQVNTFYCYAITTVDDGDSSNTSLQGSQTTPAGADATSPTIVDARVFTDAGLLNVFDTNDVIRLDFSEALDPATATAAGNQLVLSDGTDTFTITNGTDSNWVLGADGSANANRRLTITLTGSPTDTNNATGDNVANMPATIQTASANVRDVTGNPVNIAGSPDNVVDKEV